MPKTESNIYYPGPDFLTGIIGRTLYAAWLYKKARNAYRRDLAAKKPFAINGSCALYQKLIHEAVIAGQGKGPFSGETLDWNLIILWDTGKIKNNFELQCYFFFFNFVPYFTEGFSATLSVDAASAGDI